MAKRTRIDGGGWTTKLADAIEASSPGDVIEVTSGAAAQLGHGAARRMKGEAHGLTFEVDGAAVAYDDGDDE